MLTLALLPAVLGAQTPLLQRRANLVVEGVSLNDALLALRRSAGISIAFSPDDLPAGVLVTCRCDRVTVGEALRRMLQGTSLTWRATNTQVLIVAQPSEPPAGSPPRAGADVGVVRGRVMDALTGDPAAYAVALLDNGQRDLSDASGLFFIRGVPPGPHSLRVMRIGYEPRTLDGLEAAAGDTIRLTVALNRLPIQLTEVVVAPGTFGLLDAPPPGTASTMSRELVRALPQLGEDVFRSMDRLPGVAAADVSTRLSVRGSLDREVSTRLDGLELYDPYHLNDMEGVFGIVDLNALGGATLRAGGFGIEYGGRAGAVMDMTSSPVLGLPRANLGVTLSNITLLGQSGFAGDRGSWLVSGRGGSLGLLLRMVGADDRVSPQFNDVFAKLAYQVAPGHLVTARVLRSQDDLSLNITDAWDGINAIPGLEEGSLRTHWTSTYGWASWEARVGSRIDATTMAWAGQLGRLRDGWMLDVGRVGTERASALDDRDFSFAGGRTSLKLELGSRTLLQGGAELMRGEAAYRYDGEATTAVLVGGTTRALHVDTTHVAIERSGRQFGAWAGVRVQPVDALTLDAGVRYDRVTWSRDENLAPRVLASLDVDDRTTIQASLGRYVQSQGLHELSTSDGETAFARAELTDLAALGVVRRLGAVGSARVDLYRRVTTRPRPQYLSLEQRLRLFPEAEDDRLRIDPLRGEASGIELSLHGRSGAAWEWSAGYTIARAEDLVVEAQRCGSEVSCAGTGWIARSRDQRHALRAQVGWQPNDRWLLTVAWLFHSGWPATAWSYNATVLPDTTVFWERTFGAVHGERLPAYHRLDLRLTRTWNVASGRLEVFVDLFNAYGRRNEVAPNYSGSYANGVTYTQRRPGETALPFLPSLGVRYHR